MTPRIHQALKKEEGLLPAVHLVDPGFLDAELLVDSRADYGVELLGPTRTIPRWRWRAAAGFGVADFAVDWEGQRAICPAGHASVEWRPRVDTLGAPSVYIRFSEAGSRTAHPVAHPVAGPVPMAFPGCYRLRTTLSEGTDERAAKRKERQNGSAIHP